MLIDEIDGVAFASEYPELIGKRVLITGIRSALGREIVQGFADARVRLVAHFACPSAADGHLREQISSRALDARVLVGGASTHLETIELVRSAVQAFDGVDAVINLVEIEEIPDLSDATDVEGLVRDLLALPSLATRVAANRMRTTLVAGSILNILTTARNVSPRTALIASIARSVLGGFTRSEASEWAQHGIRINAIAPGAQPARVSAQLSSAPDVSTLAMHLACERGHQLSGLTFEAYAG